MAVIDGRRAPFCWLSIAALELIADNVAEGKLEGIRNTYLGLAQVAARARDGQHDGFEATVQEIAAAACVHRATIKRHLPELERLGLLEVRARTAPNGARMPSAYVLLEPTTEVRDTRRPTDNGTPAEPPAHHAPPPAHHAPPGAHEPPSDAPPSRARPDAVKKEEVKPTPTLRQAGGSKSSKRASRARGTNPRATGTNPRAMGTNPRHLAELEAAAQARGPAPDPPGDELTEAWHAIRDEIRGAVGEGAWSTWLEPLELGGTRDTELVLYAPANLAAFAADRYARILTAAAAAHITPAPTVRVLELEALAA